MFVITEFVITEFDCIPLYHKTFLLDPFAGVESTSIMNIFDKSFFRKMIDKYKFLIKKLQTFQSKFLQL